MAIQFPESALDHPVAPPPSEAFFGRYAARLDRPRLAARLLVALWFLGLAALGVAIHGDYGYSYDEARQRLTGAMSVKHVLETLAPASAEPLIGRLAGIAGHPDMHHPLDVYQDRDYGVAFEAPAVLLELLLGLTDTQDVYRMRHLLTFLVCLGGAFAVYRLAARRFADRRLGLLAAAFLLFSPRLFADSFYNSKDAVFMAVLAIALNTLVGFALRPRPASALLHALVTAFAIDVRIVAILVPIATVAVLGLRGLKREAPPSRSLTALAIYLVATAALVVALWPWLWADPLGRFGEALDAMSQFRFDNELLYNGTFVDSTELPWHYIPVWITITTPPLYLLLFAVGAAAILGRLAVSRLRLWAGDAELQDLVFLGMAVLPVAGVALLQAVLYDGWRQLYFVYPAFLLVAVRGWQALWSGSFAAGLRRPALAAVTAASLAATGIWMAGAHPLQNVYFNRLAGADVKQRYELDYWGLAVRAGLEDILARDPSPTIHLRELNWMDLAEHLAILAPQDRRRLRITTGEDSPHYVVTNSHRWGHRLDHWPQLRRYELFREVTAGDLPVLWVFRPKGVSDAAEPKLAQPQP